MTSRFLSFAKKGTKKKVSPSWTGHDQPVLGVDQKLLRTALNHSWFDGSRSRSLGRRPVSVIDPFKSQLVGVAAKISKDV